MELLKVSISGPLLGVARPYFENIWSREMESGGCIA